MPSSWLKSWGLPRSKTKKRLCLIRNLRSKSLRFLQSLLRSWLSIKNIFRFQISNNNFSLLLSPLYYFRIHALRAWLHKLANHFNSNLDIGKLARTFFAYFSFCFRGVLVSCFLSFLLHKIVTLLFEILWSFGVLILAKCCGSFNKCNTYFLRRLDLSLFFRKYIFYT